MIQDNYFETPFFFSLLVCLHRKKILSAAAFGVGIGIMYSASFKKSRDPGFESRTVDPHLFLIWDC